jgi:hypothetical protein
LREHLNDEIGSAEAVVLILDLFPPLTR